MTEIIMGIMVDAWEQDTVLFILPRFFFFFFDNRGIPTFGGTNPL